MPTTAKDELREVLERMPDDWSADEIRQHLVNYSKLLAGIEQSERGESIPLSQVRELVKQWHATSTSHPKP